MLLFDMAEGGQASQRKEGRGAERGCVLQEKRRAP
jgi:hypothetical protein